MGAPPKKMGRPAIAIDYKILDDLLKIQCTLRECASVLNCSEDTIERAVQRDQNKTFADYSREKRSAGLASLRRRQYNKAVEQGDTVMLIWLGKQYLNQSDKQKIEADISSTHVIIEAAAMDQMQAEWDNFQQKLHVSRN